MNAWPAAAARGCLATLSGGDRPAVRCTLTPTAVSMTIT